MEDRHPLGMLITNVREVNGWSLEDVAERARRRGFAVSKSKLSQMANDPIVTVSARQVEMLAAGLNLPPSTVLRAFLASMGLDLGDRSAPSVEEAILGDGRLSSDERDMLVDLVRLTRRRRQRDRKPDISTGPPTPTQ